MFRAVDEIRQATAAVKLFRVDPSTVDRERFVRELELLSRKPLNHPSIVNVREVGVAGSDVYAVMPFVESDSLDVLRRRRLAPPTSDVLRAAAELGGAIDFAAATGVHHGRLGFADVFLDAAGVRVTGFGIADAWQRSVRQARGQSAVYATHQGDIRRLAEIVRQLLEQGEGIDAGRRQAAAMRKVLNRALDDSAQPAFATALEFVEALTAAAFDGKRSSTAPARRRTGAWPVVLALVTGIAVGAAADRLLASHPMPRADVPPSARAAAPASPITTAPQPMPTPPPDAAPTRHDPQRSASPAPAPRAPAPRAEVAAPSAAGKPRGAPTDRSDTQGETMNGMLFVDSQPRGARLFVDGRFVGTTPAGVPALTSGFHDVRVEQSGLREWSSPVRVDAARLNRLMVTLEEQR